MRVSYFPPNDKTFDLLFARRKTVKGGDLNSIEYFKSPIYYQRGSGLFNILSSIGRVAYPFFRRYILPAAGELVSDVAQDYGTGMGFKSALKSHAKNRLTKVAKRILGGKGKKTSKVRGRRSSKKKSKTGKKNIKSGRKIGKKGRTKKPPKFGSIDIFS